MVRPRPADGQPAASRPRFTRARDRLLLLALLVAAASPVEAAPARFVSATGKDTAGNTCTSPATPCRSIGRALAVAADGDLVAIARGKYTETLSLSGGGARTLQGGWDPAFQRRDPARYTTTLSGGRAAPALAIGAASGVTSHVTLADLVVATTRPPSGGAISVLTEGTGALTLVLEGVTVSRNTSTNGGGGLRLTARGTSTLVIRIEDSRLVDNAALGPNGVGGALRADTFDTSVFDLRVSDTLFDGNRASSNGGAVRLRAHDGSAVTAAFTRSRFHANESGGEGGGLLAAAHVAQPVTLTLDLVNTIFTANQAALRAGALMATCTGTTGSLALTATNVTVAANAADLEAGGIKIFTTHCAVTAELTNAILWGNTAGFGDDLVLFNGGPGSVTATRRFSDVGDVFVGGASNMDGGGNLSVDPRLWKPARGDVRLRPGSPMIDAGTCAGAPTDDHAGQPRPNPAGPDPDRCDIGADED